MPFIHTKSRLDVVKNIKKLSEDALVETFSDPTRIAQLDLFTQKIDLLADTIFDLGDDEVLYTTPDMHAEYVTAYWNMSSGYYKTAAASLRNALEVGIAGLFFMHTSRMDRSDYNFWEMGERETPNWGEMKTLFKRVNNFAEFNTAFSSDIVENTYQFFRELCCYTHSKSYASYGGPPTNYMTLMGGTFPSFDREIFKTLLELADTTIEFIAMMWFVGYPNIVAKDKEWGGTPALYYPLLKTPLGLHAADYAFKHAVI